MLVELLHYPWINNINRYIIFFVLVSFFTEKLMGTPNVTDNYRGYEESDLSKRAGNLRDKPFLLIHGSADNTVHFQHSMILVHALTEEGIMFRHQVSIYMCMYEVCICMSGCVKEIE